jgi:hypothetical protein
MNVIYKYPLDNPNRTVEVKMPINARIIFVALQRGVLTLWAQVNPDLRDVPRYFEVLDTGETFADDSLTWREYHHCGSVITPDGGTVLHVYELIQR